MSGSRSTRSGTFVALLLIVLVVAGAVTLVARGGTSTTVSTSTSAAGPSLITTPSPAPTGPGMIAFTKGTISGPESANAIDSLGIYIVRRDGTGLKELAPGGSHPAWSPDGSKIAYHGAGGIWVMNPDGSGQRLVAASQSSRGRLAWSPDGGQIAFSFVVAPDVAALAVVNADGSDYRQITPAGEPVTVDDDPTWAPDGRILFIRWTQTPAKELPSGEIVAAEGDVPRFDICSINPDGSGFAVLRTARRPTNFALSPDGKWLVIWDGASDRLVRLAADGRGREVVLVINVHRFASPKAFFAVASSWSPGGKKIAFAADEGPWIGPSALYVVNADGSGLGRVPHAGMGFNPVWRPR